VAIARALVNQPAVILADEPTGNLDSKTGLEIIELLCKLQREENVTIITATHDARMIAVSDRVVWIRDGKLERLALRKDLDVQVGGMKH
jgi:putative ABC transport system ATP-binding protein